jgi:tRNA threonylcarbamoyladenosine biosynthesis protein TsaB
LVADSGSIVLAIDTSTEMAGIALYSRDHLSELTWHAGRNQTQTLLTQIEHLLKLNGLTLHDVGAIAVTVGPGMFNGLRVGLSTAKGLGFGRSIPVFGFDTLDVTAYPHRQSTGSIRAFVPAGRGRVVSGDYRLRSGQWTRAGDPQNRHFSELSAGLNPKTMVVGEVPSGSELESLDGIADLIPGLSLRSRRPGHLAELGWSRWKSGQQDESATIEPIYVHGTRRAT